MPKIVVESGSLAGEQFPLPPGGEPVVIGRGEGSGIHLADGMVSRTHCVLKARGKLWVLEDQGSSNGTLVNGAEVKKKRLSSGDVIRVGETLLSFVAEDTDPLIGTELAGCRLEKRLGRGGSGTVYRAKHISLDRLVAIKILAPSLARDEKFVERFLKEARAAARLNHKNVVQVHDAGQDGRLYYITMEYLEKGTLRDLLLRRGRLEPPRAVSLVLDAVEALMFAESHKLVHRDVKPANLLLDRKGALKLGDLGIACDLGSRADSSLALAGSPRYMAPEQVYSGKVDHRADIYALGATLYHMLAGEPPFNAPNIPAILKAKTERDPKPLSEKVQDVPVVLSKVVQKMMARAPQKRYSSARELKKTLLRVSGNLVVEANARKARERKEKAAEAGMPMHVKVGLVTFVVLLVIGLVLLLLAYL